MKAAVIMGSIGAAILASSNPSRKGKSAETLSLDPLADTSSPRTGTIYRPEVPIPIMDGSPYCVVDAVLSCCAKKLCESGRLGVRASRSMPSNRSFRIQLFNLILSSPFNDILYGEKPLSPSGQCGPHGRLISMCAKHADNLSLIRSGSPLVRTIDSRGRTVSREQATSLPTLWIPLISLEDLAQGSVTTGGYEYEDGSSTIVPPPPIMGLV
jgi:hypothetical protein